MDHMPLQLIHRRLLTNPRVVSEQCHRQREREFQRQRRRAGRSSGRKRRKEGSNGLIRVPPPKTADPDFKRIFKQGCRSPVRLKEPAMTTILGAAGHWPVQNAAARSVHEQAPFTKINNRSRQNKTRIGLHQDHAIARSLRYPDASLRILGGIRDRAVQSTRVIASGEYRFPQRW